MALTLRWRSSTTLPVDGTPLKPETFRERTSADAARMPLRAGNGTAEVGDLFGVEGDASDGALVVEGDLTHIDGLGRRMTAGSLTVRGDVGTRLGAEMAGGRLELDGSCADWAGAEMAGGVLRIRGDAGDALGAAYPGSRRGMREGLILVEGSAGADAGLMMRRGLIAVKGPVGPGLGRNMIAGTIYAGGAVGPVPGAGMKRGTLVLPGLGDDPEQYLSPTFPFAVRMPVRVLSIYASLLSERYGFEVPPAISTAEVDRYNGDLAVGGRGEILVAVPPSTSSH
jgi:formylmethanofuran dehydrogenase subunit C